MQREDVVDFGNKNAERRRSRLLAIKMQSEEFGNKDEGRRHI